jgi:Zn finger protein HypA/HybF involved in hydrogenase expression
MVYWNWLASERILLILVCVRCRTDTPGVIRQSKLNVPTHETNPESHHHNVNCPYCHTSLVITSPMVHILMARRNCPACGQEFLIENGKAVRVPDVTRKKTSKKAAWN